MEIIIGDIVLWVEDRKKSCADENNVRVKVSIQGKGAVVGAQELIAAVDTISKMSCRL